MTEISPEITEIVEEAKETFDLDKRLRNRKMRKPKTVVVYTDEDTAEDLGRATELKNQYGVIVGYDRQGLIGELHALENPEGTEKPDAKKVAALKKQIKALRTELEASAFEFEIQAVPPIIVKDCRRKAKVALSIKGKNIPEDKADDYYDATVNQILEATVNHYVDRESNTKVNGVTLANVDSFRGFLPPKEFQKLDDALGDIQFKDVISEAVTADADF